MRLKTGDVVELENVVGSGGAQGRDVIFADSFESVAVTSSEGYQLLCPPNEPACVINAWQKGHTHPDYLKIFSENGTDWETPYGTQALRVFGYQRCPNLEPCGAITSDAV